MCVCVCEMGRPFTTGESKHTRASTRPGCLENRRESKWREAPPPARDTQQLPETPDPNKDMGPAR